VVEPVLLVNSFPPRQPQPGRNSIAQGASALGIDNKNRHSPDGARFPPGSALWHTQESRPVGAFRPFGWSSPRAKTPWAIESRPVGADGRLRRGKAPGSDTRIRLAHLLNQIPSDLASRERNRHMEPGEFFLRGRLFSFAFALGIGGRVPAILTGDRDRPVLDRDVENTAVLVVAMQHHDMAARRFPSHHHCRAWLFGHEIAPVQEISLRREIADIVSQAMDVCNGGWQCALDDDEGQK